MDAASPVSVQKTITAKLFLLTRPTSVNRHSAEQAGIDSKLAGRSFSPSSRQLRFEVIPVGEVHHHPNVLGRVLWTGRGVGMPFQGVELLIVLAVVVLLFGSALLPKLARSWTGAIREVKHTIHEKDDTRSGGPQQV